MTKPRKQQISLDSTSYYHVMTRCVRHSYLCGKDRVTGRCYEHRRLQIESEVLRLASVFYIDIAAFAVLSNHYHLVLHVDKGLCDSASTKSIISRWHQVTRGTPVTQRYLNDEPLEPHELEQIDALVNVWQGRLCSISWFMKFLNETIAKRANQEDECTGHFWESRFKSQALLDEQAVLSCMAYVDLNLVRAGVAATPEESDHTSIQRRIRYWKEKAAEVHKSSLEDSDESFQPKELLPFVGEYRQVMVKGIMYNLTDYLELLDWTGRQIRKKKIGVISEEQLPILARLNISPAHWVYLCTHFESRFKGLVGSVNSLQAKCTEFGLQRCPNYASSKQLFC